MTLHLSGLISGLDTETLVTTLLENSIYQTRIDNTEEEVTELEDEVSAWSEISGLMTTLTDSLYTLYSSSKDTWDLFTATSSDEDVLTATADKDAVAGTYKIVVSTLAQAHSVASSKASGLTGDSDANADTDLIAAGVLTDGDTFTIEGVTFTVGGDEYGQTVDGAESITTLMNKINYANTQGEFDNDVTATIIDNSLVITRGDTGSTEIVMSEGTGTVLQDLEIFSAAGTYNEDNELVTAQNASFTVNGISVSRSGNSLTDVINGVTLELAGEGTATLTIARDTDTVKNAILDFITNYNAVIKAIESYTEVDLSDADDPEVGALQGDTLARMIPYNLRALATKLNSDFTSENASYTYDGSTGVLNSLQALGVWTGLTDDDEEDDEDDSDDDSDLESYANRLSLQDEDKLDYMLENYFDEMEQFFKGLSGGEEDGWAEGMYNYSYNASDSTSGQITRKTSSLNDDLNDKETLIDDLTDDLDDYETLLWDKFSVMEEAMSTMSSELVSLCNELGIETDD